MPPFGPARKCRDAALDLVGVARIDRRELDPYEGATACMRPNRPIRRACRVAKDAPACTPGAISLSSSSHFAADAVFEMAKASDIAAGPRQAGDEAGADRIGDMAKTIGMVRVARK